MERTEVPDINCIKDLWTHTVAHIAIKEALDTGIIV